MQVNRVGDSVSAALGVKCKLHWQAVGKDGCAKLGFAKPKAILYPRKKSRWNGTLLVSLLVSDGPGDECKALCFGTRLGKKKLNKNMKTSLMVIKICLLKADPVHVSVVKLAARC